MMLSRSGGGVSLTRESAEGLLFGVEVGSLESFYSLQHRHLGQFRLIRAEVHEDEDARHILREVQTSDAHVLIEERESLTGRTLTVTALADSRLMDAVLRFEVPLQLVNSVSLAGEALEWTRSNKYRQQLATTAVVHLKSGVRMAVTPSESSLPPGMDWLVYLRDEPDRWILHFRARAERPDFYSLRGCSRWYNKSFGPSVQAMLAKFPWLAQKTLYLRERISQRIPFQSNGAVLLRQGERIHFSVNIEKRAFP